MPMSRRLTRNGRSATIAPGIPSTASCRTGSGPQAQTCQSCHMPNKDVFGNPYRSKIAAIQEYSNFPQSEHALPPQEIDLPVRVGLRQAHAGRPERLSAQDGVAIPRRARHPQERPDAHLDRHRLDPDRRERDARSGGEQDRDRHRRRRAQRERRALGARHRDQSRRPQIPLGCRLPPRLHRVQRARCEQQGAVGLGPDQRGRRHRRRREDPEADQGRALVEGRLLGAPRRRRGHPSAALSGDHAGRIRRRSTRSWSRRRRRMRRDKTCGPDAKLDAARSPPASCRSAAR